MPDGWLRCRGTLEDVLYHGASSRCHVRVDDGTTIAVTRAEDATAAALPSPGSTVSLAWRPESMVWLEA